jgi:hypothetical protein
MIRCRVKATISLLSRIAAMGRGMGLMVKVYDCECFLDGIKSHGTAIAARYGAALCMSDGREGGQTT